MQLTEESVIKTLRRTWQPIANAADIPVGQVQNYTLLGVKLVIARFAENKILVADAACPHKGADLSKGHIAIATSCARIMAGNLPRTEAANRFPRCWSRTRRNWRSRICVLTACRSATATIWTKLEDLPMADGSPYELPVVPEFEDPRWTYVMGPPMRFEAGWRREVENYLDMTHFAFAHSSTLGPLCGPADQGHENHRASGLWISDGCSLSRLGNGP